MRLLGFQGLIHPFRHFHGRPHCIDHYEQTGRLVKLDQRPGLFLVYIEDGARPTGPEKALLKKLKGLLAQRANELEVQPELLAGRRDLQALVRGETDTRATSGWRREVLGNELLAIAAGD